MLLPSEPIPCTRLSSMACHANTLHDILGVYTPTLTTATPEARKLARQSMTRSIAYLAKRRLCPCTGPLVGACVGIAHRSRDLGTMSYLSIIDGNGDQNPMGLEVIFPSLTPVL